MIEKQLIEITNKIRALAQIGLVYAENDYDTERNEEIIAACNEAAALLAGRPVEEIKASFMPEAGYVTPKVDVRAVVFNKQGDILMSRESSDGNWSLPGGWADVGYTPREVAVKETKEETGMDVVPVRLLAVLDKRCHNHPPSLHYIYKIFILCELAGGALQPGFDILDCRFFAPDDLPPLSPSRITKEQMERMFEYKNNPLKEAIVD